MNYQMYSPSCTLLKVAIFQSVLAFGREEHHGGECTDERWIEGRERSV